MTFENSLRRAGRAIPALALAVGVAALIPGLANAEAGASNWFVTKQNEVRLVSATEGVGDSKTLQLGLQFKLKKGWKVYWRSPGDAGFPPRMNWKQSANLGETRFDWPTPTRFEVLGYRTLGYKDEVVFPITAKVEDQSQPLKLRADLNYLTCDDVCIPYKTRLSLDLPAGDGDATDHFQLINKFAAKVPGDGKSHGLNIEKVETAGEFTMVKKDVRNGFVRVVATSAVPFKNPDIFVEGPELAFFSPPEVTLEDGGKRAVLAIPASEEDDTKIQTASLKLTIVDGDRAATQTHYVGAGPPISNSSSDLPISLPFILGLAVIGGLILNLMPCVLPVISLKVLGLVSYGGAETKAIRMSFFASSLGIIFSFLVIASALVGLKLAGSAVGWGIQFQHPWFIVGLIVIVSLFSYNLWGLFEVNLPAWLGNIGSQLSGGGSAEHQSFAGNFCTGAFATILATPCSAPFLSTAVGFALAGSIFDIYAVYATLGIGMALPFIAITLFPSVTAKLPKPGAWMVKVKYFLGIALAATAAWLISVLAVQLSLGAAAIVGALMIGMGVILFGKRFMADGWLKAATVGILAVVFAAFATPYQYSPSVDLHAKSETHWVAFEPEKIPEMVATGKTVFVDVTAEWCITCQINKATVLNRGGIFEVLSGGGDVVAMKGDWTRPDPKITAYLKSFGRFGIPFNAVYGPSNKKGIVLPELLTAGLVWDAMGTASGGAFAAKQ